MDRSLEESERRKMKRITLFLLLSAICTLFIGCEPCRNPELGKYLDNESIVIEKYSTQLKNAPFYLYIAIIRIDMCQYILVKKHGGEASIIHKADCANPLHSEKK